MAIFEDETFEAIMERMLSRIPDDISKEEGDVVYDLLAPAAIELANAYISMDTVLDLGFADSTYGEYLDRRAAEQDVIRKDGVKAAGVVMLTGTPGLDVPSGTRLATVDEDPIYFLTTEDIILTDGTGIIGAEAEFSGVTGNVGAGEIVTVTGDMQFIAVINDAPFVGGIDEETDEELLARYTEKISKPATSGNVNEYVQWAKSVPGVSDAVCYPTWNGPGTVKVVVINGEKRSPSQSVINATAAYIESVRPVNADVTVVGIAEKSIDISVTITLTSGKTADYVQAQISDNLTVYFKSIATSDTILRYTQVANAILDADGVLDYADLLVNGRVANIEIADEAPVVGAILITTN